MKLSQFNFLRDSFGDTKADVSERWKCVKYIIHDKFTLDLQRLIKNNTVTFINNEDIGPGFYILGCPNSDMGIQNSNEKVITFFPLEFIMAMSIVGDYVDKSFGELIETGMLDPESEEYKLMADNIVPLHDFLILIKNYMNNFTDDSDFQVIID